MSSKLEGSTGGWAYNFGLQWMPVEKLTIGGVYRGNVELEFDEGEATFSNVPAGFEPLFPSTTGKSKIKLPNMIGFGIAYDFSDQFTAEFDWMQLGWSSYDKLVIELTDPVAGQTELEDEKNYEDSFSLRFGLEYRINEAWAVRGGYLRDNNAVPDTHVEPVCTRRRT